MKKLVILPTYNESKNIIKIIDMLLNLDTNLDILVVDDNSPDNTAEIVRNHNKEKIFIEKRAKKNGLGSAYIYGFNWALENKYENISAFPLDVTDKAKCKEIFEKVKNKYNNIDIVFNNAGAPDFVRNIEDISYEKITKSLILKIF